MRAILSPFPTVILCLSVAGIGNVRAAEPSIVYLDGPRSLAALRQANPVHYARAERIIAAAGELCKPGALGSEFARFEAKDISCEALLLKTSNPPKKQLTFTLDNIRYLALVTVMEETGKTIPVND